MPFDTIKSEAMKLIVDYKGDLTQIECPCCYCLVLDPLECKTCQYLICKDCAI